MDTNKNLHRSTVGEGDQSGNLWPNLDLTALLLYPGVPDEKTVGLVERRHVLASK